MKADLKTQLSILRKIEAARKPLRFRFDSFVYSFWTDAEAYNLNLMIEKGWIVETQITETVGRDGKYYGTTMYPGVTIFVTAVDLSVAGHAFLHSQSWHGRLESFAAIAGKSFAMSLGNVLWSVVSAVVTVLAMNYLGLNK